MKHKPLFTISIAHPYYDEGRCPDVRIALSAEGEALARRHRLAQKSRADGAIVLAPVDDEGAPFLPFAEDAALTFELRAWGDDFHRFTDTAALLAMDAPLYTNAAGQSPLPSGALEMVDRGGGAGRRPEGVLAGVEIAGLGALVPSETPAAFQIALAPKSARWVYYVVTDVPEVPDVSGALEIVDAAPAPAAPIAFSAAGTRDLVAVPDASDPVAAALAARYPGLRRLRFASDAPVASSAQGRKHIELHVDGTMVQEMLPNPSIRAAARIAVEASGPPEDAWVCVIEHITQGALS